MSWIDQRPDDAMAGAFEAIGPEAVASVEAPLFREAMSKLGAETRSQAVALVEA